MKAYRVISAAASNVLVVHKFLPIGAIMKKKRLRKIIKKEPKVRRGRPELADDERRAGRISVPVNKYEEDEIMRSATANHMTKAGYLRYRGVGYRMPRPIPAINIKAHRGLALMATNLKKLMTLLNTGKCHGISPSLINDTHELLQSVRRKLLTGDDSDSQNQ
ncbi:MAG TPA: hypothetical protein VF703_11910 [Pyrinomonadaceae bacterium]